MSAHLSLLEIFQRTLKFLQLYAPDDPKAGQALQAVFEALSEQLDFSGSLEIDVFQSRGRFQLLANGQLMDGPPQAVTSLAQSLIDRRIHRISFERGMDEDELRILFFLLQLKPQRLVELGGPTTFSSEMPNILLNEGITLSGVGGLSRPVPMEPVPMRPLPALEPIPTPPRVPTPPPIPVLTTMPLANVPMELPTPPRALTRPLPPEWDPSVFDVPPAAPPPLPATPKASSQLTSARDTLKALLGDPLPEPEQPAEEALPMPPVFSANPSQDADPPAPAVSAVPPPVVLPPLNERLAELFGPIADSAQSVPPKASAPWSTDQLEVLKKSELRFADLAALQGSGELHELNREDFVALRDALRQALWSLPPTSQGSILLGLPVFPPGEHALQRAMDYLAPELLAQTVAEVELRLRPPRPQLALLVATLLHCVKDREMSLEALRGRLQFEGWDILDLEALYADIRWECQGTDTKLNLAVQDQGLMDLESSQIGSICRQSIRSGRLDAFQTFWKALEEALWGQEDPPRRKAAQVFADLTECIIDPGLPLDYDIKLRELLAKHITLEMDPEALGWMCQGIETMVSQAMVKPDLDYASRQVENILNLAVASATRAGGTKISQALHDLYLRMAGARNVNALLPLIYQPQAEPAASQLNRLLGLLGQPAARHLVYRLGQEEDRPKRYKLLDALRAIGPKAELPLREALAAPEWYLVRNVVSLLGEIGESSAFDDVALTLSHKDARVRRMAAKSMGLLNADRAVPLLIAAMPAADPNTLLELVAQLGDLKDPRAVSPLVELLQDGKATGPEAEQLRQTVLESLGAIGSPEVVPVLSKLFKKKGFLGRLEPLPLRMAAARALGAIGTREAREAMALALEIETKDEVKALLRMRLMGD
ncbi:MAG: HEAT repeat domain-containing protein [Holophagaceae bacterium]|nr:HEAT repeat domain-containing protein [Holophagaceae bacterium]